MTKTELLKILNACAENSDREVAHGDADDALIAYINDPDIEAAYGEVSKWYA